MGVCLRIGVLGTAQRSGHGEIAMRSVAAAFQRLVVETARSLDVAAQLGGEVDCASAVIHCPAPEAALALARRIFRRAFLAPRTPEDVRLWLHGVAVPSDADEPVHDSETPDGLPGIDVLRPSHAANCGRAILAAGWRGMRMLVDDRLLTDQMRGMFRIPLGRLGVIPFRRMNHTPYPGAAGKGCQDFLWMAETPNEWQQYTTRMKQRMLWSAHETEELADAAATQVVFHECDAILNSVLRKNRDQDGEGRVDPESESEPDRRRVNDG